MVLARKEDHRLTGSYRHGVRGLLECPVGILMIDRTTVYAILELTMTEDSCYS